MRIKGHIAVLSLVSSVLSYEAAPHPSQRGCMTKKIL